MNEFKIGDRIKLKSYNPFGDWSNHKNEKAVIINVVSNLKNVSGREYIWDFQIKWNDGATSFVEAKNLRFPQWDTVNN